MSAAKESRTAPESPVAEAPKWPVFADYEPGRRFGNWTYLRGLGWRLSGTDLVLDFDRLGGCGDLRGAYVVMTGPKHLEAIDHYLDSAMRWVEEHVADYERPLPTSTTDGSAVSIAAPLPFHPLARRPPR